MMCEYRRQAGAAVVLEHTSVTCAHRIVSSDAQEKFRLDLDDEAAVQWMQALLNESATALMPQIVETTHRWAQYWR